RKPNLQSGGSTPTGKLTGGNGAMTQFGPCGGSTEKPWHSRRRLGSVTAGVEPVVEPATRSNKLSVQNVRIAVHSFAPRAAKLFFLDIYVIFHLPSTSAAFWA